MNFNKSLKLINKNGIKSMISSTSFLNKPTYIRKQSNQLFFSSNNKNNDNNNNNINNIDNNYENKNFGGVPEEDKKALQEILDKVESDKESFKKFIAMDEEKTGFKYEKSPVLKLQEGLIGELFAGFEKRVREDEKKYDKLIEDLNNRRIESHRLLKKEKFKSNIFHYTITVCVIIIAISYFSQIYERSKNFTKIFDENWEALRVIVNNRDSQKEKKSKLIDSISTTLLQHNNTATTTTSQNNNNNIDLDEIKEDVESIINQFCIQDKPLNQIFVDNNNNDISNSKI
ncbi:random cDNA clone veg110 [Dictyostelium discoideum AX4]|uniref:Random cDNA clone veg110 n=1 Tax=Dictyostelium discoideum TaxID=44689 RepID=Q54KN1_DICDI|nr:random cDNA clone veg110 [Dictyostelium discoideum AX4]EAL63808.1 random cDNA clone veg110 [Dictyostelium discoideum AX4]|eukprot:XP_637326.1 random cDNA clone veg110 [Dictyostelium discoideum AX4]